MTLHLLDADRCRGRREWVPCRFTRGTGVAAESKPGIGASGIFRSWMGDNGASSRMACIRDESHSSQILEAP